MRHPILIFIFFLNYFFTLPIVEAEPVTAAVSSNFLNTFKHIAGEFEKSTGNKVHIVSGSTGKLFTQIVHGAPYDIFLAADQKRPALLKKRGLVLKEAWTYAFGKLVLWTTNSKYDLKEGEKFLRKSSFKYIALANPKTAPYGKATLDTLNNLKLYQKLKSKMVFGENVGQTFQFIATQNAELGFISLSQVLDPNLKIKGTYWKVPVNYYDPIAQDIVLLKQKSINSSAVDLLDFLKSKSTQRIIEKYGYGITNKEIK